MLSECRCVAFLKTLLDQPEDFFHLTKRFSTAITSVLVYGKRPLTFDDVLCKDVSLAMARLGENLELGASPPVDEWPFSLLRHVPSRFAFWKRRAIEHGKYFDDLWGRLFNDFVERYKVSGPRGCMFDKFVQLKPGNKEIDVTGWSGTLHSLQFLGGEILEGGADTTSSTLQSFFMAMACFPETQRKAQQQIDAVVGPDRTPNWNDFEKIPYVTQIQKECLRWRSVTISGMPHMAREEDVYRGYRIPKGARVIQTTWYVVSPE